MEYQLYLDPTWGKRVKISDEHRLIARWFNDELYENDELIEAFFTALDSTAEQLVQGREMRLLLGDGEACFQSHGLFHDDEQTLALYSGDDLALDESELQAWCGVEDLRALASAWRHFR
ncbi:YacL family protein [Pseudoalteromonas ruthenica]|uniref:YacL family protein n=1 Tax=Pseudoalteromonas ruthenica TaxID=151081 RepID=UPI0012444305|nr:YacL family protein [Pseudoalteromonas ruthenica]